MPVEGSRDLRILVFSSLFPNSVQPTRGVFVEQRLRQLIATGKLAASVVAPVPWFPMKLPVLGRYAEMARVPAREQWSGIDVEHPRYLVVPKIGMNLSPFTMALAVAPTVRRLLRESDPPTVLDAHYFYPDGVAASLLGRWFGLPVCITARGSDINQIARYSWPRRLIRDAADRAFAVIAVSNPLRERLLDLGVDAAKVQVLRNGVDLDRFRPGDVHAARRQVGLDQPYLLYVGHLKKGKGITLAVEAMRELPDRHLVLVGDGPLRSQLEALARQSDIHERIHFVGAKRHEELRDYYVAAAALLLPSEREGMPNVILEAMACGTPVIATRVGGIPEIMRVPITGELMSERSVNSLVLHIKSVLVKKPDHDALRRHAEKFGWRPTVDGLLEVYRDASVSRSAQCEERDSRRRIGRDGRL